MDCSPPGSPDEHLYFPFMVHALLHLFCLICEVRNFKRSEPGISWHPMNRNYKQARSQKEKQKIPFLEEVLRNDFRMVWFQNDMSPKAKSMFSLTVNEILSWWQVPAGSTVVWAASAKLCVTILKDIFCYIEASYSYLKSKFPHV